MSSRTHNAIKNITYNIGYQLLMLVLGFVNRTIFIHFLSVEYLGIQAIFKDILTLLSMADLGLTTAMTYSLYRPLAKEDKNHISGLIQFYKKLCNIIALAILVIGIGLIPFLGYIVNLDKEIPHLILYYVLYLLNTVASYIVVYKTVILVADQKGYITAKYGSIFNILQNIFLALFLWLTHDFLIYLIIQVLFTYVYNIVVSRVASSKYPYINNKVILKKDETRKIFNNIKSVFIYKSSGVLISATDNTIISIIIGTATVGLYSNYMLIVTKVISLFTTVFNSLTSSLGNLIVEEGEEKRYQVFRILQTTCNILSIIVVNMMLFLLQDFIGLWLGKEYLLDEWVLYAIIANFYFSVVLLPVWAYREATGLYNQIRYVMLATAVLNLIISVILGNFIGLAGILMGTSISKLLTYFWYEPVLLFNNFFGRSSRSYIMSILKSVGVLAVMIVIGVVVSKVLVVNGFVVFIIKSALLLIINIACVFGFYHKSQEFGFLKHKIVKIFYRN